MKKNAFAASQENNALEIWRTNLFSFAIRIIAFAGTFIYFVLIGFLFDTLKPSFFIAYTSVYLVILIVAFVTRIPVIYRAYTIVFLIYLVGIFSSYEKATMGDGRVWFITAALLTAVFLGRRAGLAVTFIVTLTWGAIGLLFNQGQIFLGTEYNQFSGEIWGGTTVTLFITTLGVILAIGALLVSLNKTVSEGALLRKIAEEQKEELDERRKILEKRSEDLEKTAKINRRVAALSSIEHILLQAPIMLKNDFGFISVAFFTLDGKNELRLLSSEGWNEQAYPKHDYVVSLEEDITGAAVIHDRAISNKETEKGLRVMLPETRSFASIPMRGRSSNITGVLLLQSNRFDDLNADRLKAMQLLADQIAILMENATLLDEKESALEAERRAYGDITEYAWGDFMRKQSYRGFLRNRDGIHSLPVQPYHTDPQVPGAYQVPIKLRGRIIGYIDANKTSQRAWTVPEKELLTTLAGRLESTLDSARLYEELQDRAARERMVSEASSRMRESLDVETVMQTAVQELHRALGNIAETEIWITPEEIEKDETVRD